jgi:transcription elongation factor GreA
MIKKKTAKTQKERDTLFVTQAGYDEMVSELENRKGALRDEIAQQINAARDLGDLSENQAYSDAMERKELNDNRIDELEYLISIAEIIDASASDNFIGIGHTVEIQKVGGEKRTVTLVGKEASQQADSTVGKISIDSPIGMALNSAQVGDTVAVKLPAGEVKYKILKMVA